MSEERKLLERNSMTNCRSVNSTDDMSRSSKQMGVQLEQNRRKNKDISEEESTMREELEGILKQQERVAEALEE
jgi:hypothetical protein